VRQCSELNNKETKSESRFVPWLLCC
jgi:hypothetical protein